MEVGQQPLVGSQGWTKTTRLAREQPDFGAWAETCSRMRRRREKTEISSTTRHRQAAVLMRHDLYGIRIHFSHTQLSPHPHPLSGKHMYRHLSSLSGTCYTQPRTFQPAAELQSTRLPLLSSLSLYLYLTLSLSSYIPLPFLLLSSPLSLSLARSLARSLSSGANEKE